MTSSTGALKPKEAVQAADAVYAIRIADDATKAFKNTLLNNQFVFGDKSRFTGRSGIFGSESGFGVIGHRSLNNQNEAIVVTRGTVTGADWFNNFMSVSTLSANSKLVHKGFNSIFKSFENDLLTQLRIINPVNIHCVGHSLGGALANLIAEWVDAKNLGNPYLYTFGSPRVGKAAFSESLTTRLGQSCINRVYHKTDIVPLIPVWPFVHTPQPGISCFIHSPGDYPGAAYHDRKLYIESVKSHKEWTTLRKRHPKTNLEQQVENWLASDSPLSFTGNTISMINSAILYVLKKLALAGLQIVIGETINMVDLLAKFLTRAAKLGNETLSLISQLMRRILQALGKTISTVGNLTFQFVKWVLESLSNALFYTAKLAIKMTHRLL